jgi:hypothetical protein
VTHRTHTREKSKKNPDKSICTAVHKIEIINATSWLGATTAAACKTWEAAKWICVLMSAFLRMWPAPGRKPAMP